MIKEYRDMLFEPRAVNKLNKDIKNNPEINFKIIGYNVISSEHGPARTFILVDWEKEIPKESDTKGSEFTQKRFNLPDNPQ
jgi:hypothetical protein